MRYPWISLKPAVANLPDLREPLWVASSHHTTNEAAIDAWNEIEPAALTLKTSRKEVAREDKPLIRFALYPALTRYGRSFYCDGPKHEELLTYQRTAQLLQHAKATLKTTLTGLSVISGRDENYRELRDLCPEADFCELNLKYGFRITDPERGAGFLAAATARFEAVLAEVIRFCEAWTDLPVFVKIPRELLWLPKSDEGGKFLDELSKHKRAGVILTNSWKIDIAPFIHEGQERRLEGGVLCGEALFDGTMDMIAGFLPACHERGIPIVASAGMIEEQHILLALRAGAAAVQLCTTFDYHRRSFYETLRSALTARIYMQGMKGFVEYRERLPLIGSAAIYQEPITYFRRFWAEEVQNHLKDDIRRSERMDVLVMSGATLFESWKDVLRQRFSKNLGLRILVPNVEGEPYAAVQHSWGITAETQLKARQSRVVEALDRYRRLWEDTKEERERRRGDHPESRLEIYRHDQAPFYSCYIFDDNAYVAPYPFVRAGLESPVYVFFRSSKEYDRLVDEVENLRSASLQTQPSVG